MINQVELTGVLVDTATLRHSPAGVPIARGLLEHESAQVEAGSERWVRFRVGLRAAGSPQAEALEAMPSGSRIKIAGILLRSRQRSPEVDPIIISIRRIERLTESD